MSEEREDTVNLCLQAVVYLILGIVFITSCTTIQLEYEKTKQMKIKLDSTTAKESQHSIRSKNETS